MQIEPNGKKRIFVLSVILALGLYFWLALAVDNGLTEEDIAAISGLDLNSHCHSDNRVFDDEVGCLEKIQAAVQSIGSEGISRCASKSDVIEPADFLARNYGCCFDRARFIGKTARFYGFQTRHLFLISPKYGSLSNLLPLSQSSHATSEVLTSKGWMGVDIIYGLYSRHGMFHGVKLPAPEFVFSEILHNF